MSKVQKSFLLMFVLAKPARLQTTARFMKRSSNSDKEKSARLKIQVLERRSSMFVLASKVKVVLSQTGNLGCTML